MHALKSRARSIRVRPNHWEDMDAHSTQGFTYQNWRQGVCLSTVEWTTLNHNRTSTVVRTRLCLQLVGTLSLYSREMYFCLRGFPSSGPYPFSAEGRTLPSFDWFDGFTGIARHYSTLCDTCTRMKRCGDKTCPAVVRQ